MLDVGTSIMICPQIIYNRSYGIGESVIVLSKCDIGLLLPSVVEFIHICCIMPSDVTDLSSSAVI